MYSITAILGSTAWALLFRDEAKFNSVVNELRALMQNQQAYVEVEDDYGQKLTATPAALAGFMAEDIEKSKLAYVERVIHQQRIQILAQKTAQSDPVIATHQRMQGPGIIDPMGAINGGRRAGF